MTFDNPVVGGNKLIRAAIQSPNYVAGSTGWSINADGSAEFDNVQIRGTIDATATHALSAATANEVNGPVTSTNMQGSSPNYVPSTTGWSINSDGSAEFNNLVTRGTASGPSATYDTIVSNDSFTYQGNELQGLLNNLPRGLVASGFLGSNSGSGVTTAVKIGEIDFTQVINRDYRVVFNGMHWSCQTALATAQLYLTYTTDGTSPGISSPVLDSTISQATNLNQALSFPPLMPMGTYSATDGALIRVAVCLVRLAGSGTLSWDTYANTNTYWKPLRFYVEDVGPDIGPDTWIAPATTTSKTTYTGIWYTTGVQTYQSNLTRSIATNNNVYGYQGDGTAVGNPGGNSASLWMLDYAAIQSALSGATILHTYIYTKNVHTYLNSGATARVGTHGNATLPTNFAAATQERWNQTTTEGGTVWSGDVGTVLGTELQNGTTKGFALGYSTYSSTQQLYDYGYWSQMGVKIVYQK